MDDLTFSLVQLCRRNRDGGYSTQRGRESTRKLIARQLREMGHRQMTAKSLKEKHVQILSRRWLAENLSAGTIKNRMVQMLIGATTSCFWGHGQRAASNARYRSRRRSNASCLVTRTSSPAADH